MVSRIRSLASDTMIYGIFTIVGKFLTFMLTPFYTNYLTKEEVGDITYIFAIIAFMNIGYSFGMESSFFRFYNKDDLQITKKVYSISYITIAIVGGIISIAIIIFAESIAPVITDLKSGADLIRIAALLPFLDSLIIIPFGLLRMTRKAKKFSMIRLTLIIVAVSLNIIFLVNLHWGALGVFLAQLITSIIGILLLFGDIRQFITLKLDKLLFYKMLRFGFPTLPANLSAIVLQVADRPILKALTNSEQVAMYSVNHRLGIPMMLIVAVFEYAWKPFYLSHFDDSDAKVLFSRVLTYFTLVCAAIFLLTGLFMEFLVRMPFVGGKFINNVYWEGMGIIPLILGGYYFNGLFTNFAAGFHITKKTEYLPIAVGGAALINIIINFLLIPVYGIWGASIAMIGAYFSGAVILYIFLRKIYPMSYEWKRLGIIILSSLAIYGISAAITSELSLTLSFIIRLSAMLIFVVLLKIFGLFTPAEIRGIKNLFLRR